MKLNKGKCEYMAFGGAGKVTFADGAEVERKTEVRYLGCMMNENGDMNKEVGKRIAECTIIMHRLQPFMRHGDSSVKWKIRVADAVIRARLMYGLESAMLNSTTLKRLDACQLKGLR